MKTMEEFYEAQHLAQLQPNCMDAVVLRNPHGHPPSIAICLHHVRRPTGCDGLRTSTPFRSLCPYDDIEKLVLSGQAPLISCVLLIVGLVTIVGADGERVDGRCMLQRSPPARTKRVVGEPSTTSYCRSCLSRRGNRDSRGANSSPDFGRWA